jgi:hypothetical protein
MSKQFQQISATGSYFPALALHFPWQSRSHKLHCVPADSLATEMASAAVLSIPPAQRFRITEGVISPIALPASETNGTTGTI